MKLLAYKYRLYPNKGQRVLLEKHFGSCRFIYNHFLQKKITHYKETKKTIGWVDLANSLVELKKEHEWLDEIGSQSLQATIRNLDNAYTNFFRSNMGFPKFKSRKNNKQSFCCPEANSIRPDFENDRLYLPKFINTKNRDNRLKCVFDRAFEGSIKQCTVSRGSDGKYYASILVEQNIELPKKPVVEESTAIGIDFGVKMFLTISNGEKIESPKYFKQSQDKLAKHQQELELLTKGSTKHISKKEQISKLHSKIARQRKDFLDKLSYKLTHDNQVETICIEDLSIKNMQSQNQAPTNRIIGDLGWFNLTRMLQYKSDWYGKNFLKIGRFEPSSKTCNVCGEVYHELTLDERVWKCKKCGSEHDRDVNASKNVKDFALTNMGFQKGRNYPIETQTSLVSG
jgi:putative transposase